MADDIINQIDTVLGSAPTNQPGGQTVWPVRYINPPGSRMPVIGYTGPGLVGFSNNVEEANYDITEGLVRNVYSSLTPAQRTSTLSLLKQKGFYGNKNIGVPENDLEAIAQWLDEANLAGVTRERYLFELNRSRPDVSTGGAARRYQVSNPEDLKVVFKRIAQETIGRNFSDDEVNRAVQSFQQQQIAAQKAAYGGGVTTEGMGADVFAQKFATEMAPTEAQGYKYLGYVDKFFNAIGGL
jgi:hypothetical protein